MDVTLKLDGVQEGERYILEVCVKKGKATIYNPEDKKVQREPKEKSAKRDDISKYVDEEDELMKLNKDTEMKVESSLTFGK
jgi:tRNA threonylcarbamoyladenosine modification (KEOPS) complex Cgi121 subunit